MSREKSNSIDDTEYIIWAGQLVSQKSSELPKECPGFDTLLRPTFSHSRQSDECAELYVTKRGVVSVARYSYTKSAVVFECGTRTLDPRMYISDVSKRSFFFFHLLLFRSDVF